MADDRDNDLDAGEYVLGTLEPPALRAFAERMAREPALRAAVAAWERRLAPLGDGRACAPPEGLRARIDAAIDAAGAFPTIRADEGAWHPVVPGVDRKLLHVDRERGYRSFMLRFAPGAVLPAHDHSDDEECVMIEGEIFIAGMRLAAGDWQIAPKGVAHPAITSPRGGTVFIRAPIRRAPQ